MDDFIEKAVIPAWLKKLIPEVKAPAVLSREQNETYTVTFPDGARVEQLSDLAAADAAIGNTDVVFDKSIKDHSGSTAFYLDYPSGRSKFSRMIIPNSDKKRLEGLEENYAEWLGVAADYKANPRDFYNAYRFVDNHPSFWCTMDSLPTWHWESTGHANRVSQFVGKEDGEVVVYLETGRTVEDEYKTHYHDYRLDVSGATFEEAFIRLAERVSYFYQNNGEEVTPEPPHEAPGWVQDVQERIAELDEDS